MGTTVERRFRSTSHRVFVFGGLLVLTVAGCGGERRAGDEPQPAGKRTVTARRDTVGEPDSPPRESASSSETQRESEPVAEQANATPRRPPDSRQVPDEDAVALRGIKRYESKRLRLYTDLPAERVRHLPALTDALYEELERYFGPLPPDAAGSVFQMSGYVMADPARFEAAGLVPADLPLIRHGRHRGAEFWMKDQTSDYYLAHLLLHEATHCFMTIIPNPMGTQPWYIEGMAEVFATHTSGPPPRFGVLPDDREKFPDLGRIRIINDAVASGNALNAQQVIAFHSDDFLENAPYAWSWAFCWYLANHPETRERFRVLEDNIDPEQPLDSFLTQFSKQQFGISQGFWMFVHDLCHGYDLERAAITFRRGSPPGDSPVTVTIRADRGWQASGVYVQQGKRYRISAAGRYQVGQSSKPWISEPEGITLRYVEGEPIGKLLGTIREEIPNEPIENLSMRVVSGLGREVEWTATASGTFYLRVNDAWNSLADNSGELTATIAILP